MERNLVRIALLFVAMLVAATGVLQAQNGLTAVTGTVKDQSGAVIPGVEVTVTNTATGAARVVVSNEAGVYLANQLAPGTYSLKATLPGFRAKDLANLVLPVDQTIRQDLGLEVGSQTDVVEVNATAEAVNTENAQLGNNFDTKQIIDLPLNARNIVGLLSLQNGVSIDTGSAATSGYVNGARNDQQNIVLDGVDNNQFQVGNQFNAGVAFTGALPTTLDSVQEFIVQTSGQGATSSRSSGAQVQLVTKSGSNQMHGSAYEAYRSKVTTATPYFNGQATPKPGLIRNIPGGSFGGPIIKNKLFVFGAFERRTDRSQTTVTKTVPNATYLQGILRYQRKATAVAANGVAYGTITQSCGGMLEQITNVPCDTVNPALFGPQGYLQQYSTYVNNPGQFSGGSIVCPADCSNFTTFKFNAPNIVNDNVYITRFDYTINSKNTAYIRGTLNNGATIGSPTFPDKNNGVTTYDNSKGFSAGLNSVINPRINNNFTAGLTRQSGNTTGTAGVVFGFGASNLNQTTGAQFQAIDTWNFVDNLSWIKGSHNWTAGFNFNFVNNNLKSFSQVSPGNFSSAANYVTGDFATTCAVTCASLGADYANVNNYSTMENNILGAIGALNLFNVGLQWDKNGNLLPTGSPFQRIIRMDEYDFYLQDSWKVKSNFTLNYGIHWGVMTPPWEKNGNEVNWTQSLRQRLNVQKESPYTDDQLPLLTTQLAGRANGLPDYYAPALDNWAPRVSFAYTPKFDGGILGTLAHKGGPMVVRGGYALSFDHTGGSLATNAATSGGIGLFTSQQFGASVYSINGAAQPPVPRVGGTGASLVLPYGSFPVSGTQSFTPVSTAGGWGSASSVPGIDNGLRPPSNHLVNFTLSKELPGGLVIEASYVGRFARDLMGQLDLANPVNVVDRASGQDYYSGIAQLISQYENASVGASFGTISAANAAAATASIPAIPWFESVYGGFKNWAQTGTGAGLAPGKVDTTNAFPGVTFANSTQAFYAVLNKTLKPGPNTPFILTNVTQAYEADTAQHITTNGQTQSFFLYTNVGWSNYNSGQFSIKKRFSSGYTVAGNYTWAKSMDLTSASESAGTRPGGSGGVDQILDPYHPEKNYAPSTFDRRGQFNGNFNVPLPFGTGKLIGGNMGGVFNQIFGGWSVSGILTAATGTPYSYQAALRYTLHYNGLDKPIPTQPLEYGLNHGPNANYTVPMVYWIKDQEQSSTCDLVCAQTNRLKDTSYFTNTYPNGPSARNYVYGPGIWNLDASLLKTFKVTEGISGRFSADAFNVLNHPNFQNPSNVNIDSTSGLLGNITQIQGAARVMQFNVRLAF